LLFCFYYIDRERKARVKFGIVCTEKEKKRPESRKYKETGVELVSERLENEEEEERKRSEYHSIAFSHCSPDSVVVSKKESKRFRGIQTD
jgi:hypothetical protein